MKYFKTKPVELAVSEKRGGGGGNASFFITPDITPFLIYATIIIRSEKCFGGKR